MEKVIENLQAIVDSINFVETEHSSNYVISHPDKKLLNEALDEAKSILMPTKETEIHNVAVQQCIDKLNEINDMPGFYVNSYLISELEKLKR